MLFVSTQGQNWRQTMTVKVGAILDLDTTQAERKIKSIDSEIKKLGKTRQKIEVDISKLEKAKSELQETQSQIEKLNNRKIELNADMSNIQKIKDRILEIEQEIVNFSKKKLDLGNSNMPESLKKYWQSNLSNKIKYLQNEKAQLRIDLKGYNEVEKEFKSIESNLKKLENKKIKLEAQLENGESVYQELELVDQQIDELKSERAEIQLDLDNYSETMRKLNNVAEGINKIRSLGTTLEKIGSGMMSIFNTNNTPLGKLTHFLTQGVGYAALYRMTSSAMNTLTESVSDAVDRYDQLNVSARTLEALGFTTQEVTKAQQELSDSIEGLPTTLNAAIGKVTTFASINKDLDRSTKLYEAFNDAILAFGGSSENVDNAITQYSQIMGSKMDARTLLSLQDANMMPVLTAIAEEMGMTYAEFREAFTGTDPTISLQEFEDALISLDQNGGGGLESLATMAQKSVATIGNAFDLITVRASKGMAEVISDFDEVVKEITGKSIYENVYSFTETLEEKIASFGDVIKKHKGDIQDFFETISDYADKAWQELKKFDIGSFFEGVSSYKWVLDGVKSFVSGVYGAIKGLSNLLGGGDTSKGFGRLLTGYVLGGSSLQILGKFLQKYADFADIGLNIYKKLGGKKNTSGSLLSTFSSIFGSKKATSTSLIPLGDSAGEVSTLSGKVSNLNIGNAVGKFAKLALVAAEIAIFAKALKTVDESLPTDLGSLVGKLTLLGSIMLAFDALIIGIGQLNESVGIETMATGLLSLLGEGGVIYVMAKAIGEIVDVIPTDLGQVLTQLGNFTLMIAAFTAIFEALGALALGTEGMSVILGTLGGLFAWEMVALAKEIAKNMSAMFDEFVSMADSLDTLQSFDFDTDKVSDNLESLKEAFETIASLTSGFWASLGSLVRMKVDEGTISQASSNLNKINKLVKPLQKLSKLGNISPDGVANSIQNVKDILTNIQSYLPLPKLTISTDSVENIENITDEVKAINKLINALAKIDPESIANISVESITDAIGKTNEVVKALKEVVLPDVKSGATLNQKNAQNLADVLDTFIEIIPKFSEFTAAVQANPISVEELQTAFQSMANLLGSINEEMPNGQNRLGYNLENFIDADDVQNVLDAFTNLSSLVETIKAFTDTWAQNSIDFETLKANFEQLGGALQSIVETWTGQGLELDSFKDINKVIKKMNDIATNLNTLGSTQINFEAIQSMITQIQGVLTSLSGITGTDEANSIATSIQSVVDTFNQLVTTLKGMEESFQEVGMEWGNAIYTGFENSDVSGQMSAYIDEAMATLKEKNFTSIGLNYGKQLVNGFRSGLTGMSNVLSSQISGLNGYASTFASLGATLGNALVTGFTGASAGIANSISNVASTVSTVKSTISALKFANGGIVPQYLASGGVSFRPRGTDTVPAMLTPGEFVIRKKAVDNVGLSFLRKVNNMDLKGAFSSLVSAHGSNSMQTSYSRTIVKNTTNNADNRSVVIYGKNERQEELKARRFMKCLA